MMENYLGLVEKYHLIELEQLQLIINYLDLEIIFHLFIIKMMMMINNDIYNHIIKIIIY